MIEEWKRKELPAWMGPPKGKKNMKKLEKKIRKAINKLIDDEKRKLRTSI